MALTEEDRWMIEVLEHTQALYERYLEVSKVADVVPSLQEAPEFPTMVPMGLVMRDKPIGVVVK